MLEEVCSSEALPNSRHTASVDKFAYDSRDSFGKDRTKTYKAEVVLQVKKRVAAIDDMGAKAEEVSTFRMSE